MKAAIVVIDMLNDFFVKEPLKTQKPKLVLNINQLTKAARKRKIPIIWVCQEYKLDGSDIPLHDRKTGRRITIKGTNGAQLIDELDQQNQDIIVRKNR